MNEPLVVGWKRQVLDDLDEPDYLCPGCAGVWPRGLVPVFAGEPVADLSCSVCFGPLGELGL